MQTTINVQIFDKVHRLEDTGVAHVTADENGVEIHLPIKINVCISHEELRKLVSKLEPDCEDLEHDRAVARAESRHDID